MSALALAVVFERRRPVIAPAERRGLRRPVHKSGDSKSSTTISDDNEAAPITLNDSSGPVVISNLDVGDFKQIFNKSTRWACSTCSHHEVRHQRVHCARWRPDKGSDTCQRRRIHGQRMGAPGAEHRVRLGKPRAERSSVPNGSASSFHRRPRRAAGEDGGDDKAHQIAALVAGPVGTVATIIGLSWAAALLPKENQIIDLATVGWATLTGPTGVTASQASR